MKVWDEAMVRLKLFVLGGGLIVYAGLPVAAEPLSVVLPELLKSHENVLAAHQDIGAAEDRVDVAKADYLPSVDFTGNTGYEYQDKAPGSATTSTGFREASLGATQLIWDFGKTLSQIDRSKISVQQAELRLKNTEQGLIREGVSAYLNLLRISKTLQFAKESEANIKKQTGLEEALVKRRSGLQTDVLQAKSTLAGAQANRVFAEGQLTAAMNRYRSVFKAEPSEISTMIRPPLQLDKLPASLGAAIETALKRNLGLKVAQLALDAASKTIDINKATLWGPKVEMSADLNYERNVSGTLDNKIEKLVKIEATYPLFSGGSDMATYNASLKTSKGANLRYVNQRRLVEEQVRNAWQALKTSNASAEFLRNQTIISGEFLELARIERKLGKRSLISILNQETSYVNSVSAALSAETDELLAYYNLLFAMSALDLGVFSGG